jgi:hypothetical protein
MRVSTQIILETRIALKSPSEANFRFARDSGSAGINRHVVGMKEPYRKGSSESILVSSLAGDIARCRLKRRQRYRWAGY